MFGRHTIALSVACLIGATGCASHRVAGTAPATSPGPGSMPFDAPGERDAERRAGPDNEEPTGPLDLGAALSLAVMRNPELAAFSWEVRARDAEVLQAGLRPNPEAALEIENFGGSGGLDGFGGSEITLSPFQVFELGGKRAKRRNVAEQARNLAAWDYEAKRADVLAELTKSFIALLVAQEQTALAAELVTVSEQMLDAVSRRVEAGGISPVEKGRVQVEVQTTRIDLQKAQREVEMARQRLSAIWGEVTPRFTEARGSIETTFEVPPLAEVLERIDDNPDLARWSAERAHRQSLVALERSRRIPDLRIGLGVRRFAATGDNALTAELGLPLPIFDRNQGARRATEIRLAMADEEHRVASLRAGTQLAITYQALVQSEIELTALRDEVIPEASATFESARVAYQRGRMRLTDVLDTQRTLFALRSRYYSTLGVYHQRKADIERLIGAPLAVEEAR